MNLHGRRTFGSEGFFKQSFRTQANSDYKRWTEISTITLEGEVELETHVGFLYSVSCCILSRRHFSPRLLFIYWQRNDLELPTGTYVPHHDNNHVQQTIRSLPTGTWWSNSKLFHDDDDKLWIVTFSIHVSHIILSVLMVYTNTYVQNDFEFKEFEIVLNIRTGVKVRFKRYSVGISSTP